jgi:hypothetical protein
MYKLAYGTDKATHDEEYAGETMAPMASESLRERLARLEAKGLSEADLKTLTADLDALESKHAGGSH